MHGCMDAWMHGCMDAWMHGCTDARMHGCMGAWVHRCMHLYSAPYRKRVGALSVVLSQRVQQGIHIRTEYREISTIQGKDATQDLHRKKKAYSISNRARYYRFWPLMSACAPTTVGSKKRMCGVGRRLRYEPTILTRCRWKQQLCLCSSSAGSPPPCATPSYAALPRETRLAHCLLYDDSLTLPCSPSHSSTVS